jgi:hypothetical protein
MEASEASRSKRFSTAPSANIAPALPPDEELVQIVRKGLHGTAMLTWILCVRAAKDERRAPAPALAPSRALDEPN